MTASFWSTLGSIWSTVWPILVAIIIFGLIVIIHEFGHFFFAKLFKVKVNEFAVGFGPALFKKQKGETLYSVRLIPFGGYCAMEGEDEESDDPRSFQSKKVWKRIIIVAAGAINNLILGLVLVGVMLSLNGQFNTTQVYGFVKDAPSYQSGLMPGDEILAVDGRNVYCSSDRSYMMMISEDNTLEMEVRRGEEELTLKDVTFATREMDGKTYIAVDFAVVPQEMTLREPFKFVKNTVMESVSVGRVVWMSLKDLIGGRFGMNEMMGPVGVVSTVGDTVSQAVSGETPGVDFGYLFYMMAMITINLGIVNLLPLPALDGGRLIFLLFEAIFRKPVPPKYEGWVHGIGFALLMILILVITGNDILRLVRGG